MVVVPISVYPSEVCSENGGQGWSAKVAEVKYGVARLKLSHGKWEPIYLPQATVSEGVDPVA